MIPRGLYSVNAINKTFFNNAEVSFGRWQNSPLPKTGTIFISFAIYVIQIWHNFGTEYVICKCMYTIFENTNAQTFLFIMAWW